MAWNFGKFKFLVENSLNIFAPGQLILCELQNANVEWFSICLQSELAKLRKTSLDLVASILRENALWPLDNSKFTGLTLSEYPITIDGLFTTRGRVSSTFYLCGANWYINNAIKTRLKWNKWASCSEASIGFKHQRRNICVNSCARKLKGNNSKHFAELIATS